MCSQPHNTASTDCQGAAIVTQSEFYIFPDSKMDGTVTWYAAHLSGFHKTHVYLDNRSQDTFYNDAGTMIVAVLGDRGKEGENGEA
ncbi:MAG TPA: hypothetical protein VGG46_10000 [Terriglobales bacterium]|jgi:hypothetical protein